METFQKELALLKEQGLYRQMRLVQGSQGSRVALDGREVLLLCSNNYLGLADHPLLKEAAIRAVEKFGVSSGASRLVSGTMELHGLWKSVLPGLKEPGQRLSSTPDMPQTPGLFQP